jgi:hypothetical protein
MVKIIKAKTNKNIQSFNILYSELVKKNIKYIFKRIKSNLKKFLIKSFENIKTIYKI